MRVARGSTYHFISGSVSTETHSLPDAWLERNQMRPRRVTGVDGRGTRTLDWRSTPAPIEVIDSMKFPPAFRAYPTVGISAAALLLAGSLYSQTKKSSDSSSSSSSSETVAKPLTKKQLAQKQKQLEKELAGPWKKWMNEDVIYIITDEEKQAFKRFKTDEERQQFVEQFWLRRDPTPDTEENEYKEEHYRRIAYANDHYASGIPGWKTDRGMIYIKYGPPDEIESHPSGGSYQRPYQEGGGETSTYPFEDWRYRYLDGIGTNINIEDLQSVVDSSIRYNTLPMRVRADYIRVNDATVLTNLMVQFKNSDLQYKTTDKISKATVNIYGRITSLTRRPVNWFEDTVS